jgi:hypothetical protein
MIRRKLCYCTTHRYKIHTPIYYHRVVYGSAVALKSTDWSKARVLLSLEAWSEVKKGMDMDKLKGAAGYNKRGEVAARR